ncbi:MAG: endonuclease/exonuclease/phosphatase family protein [Flavobacteriaceae bacterium]|nr:endonuclease/exonuclease/phosphatase family protein [Flavobacteriaceae bacterium]
MKQIVFLLVIFCSIGSMAQELRTMTYNIRYDNAQDGKDQWAHRKAAMVRFLRSQDLDIIGLQEVLEHQKAYLELRLPTFGFVGVGREDGKQGGEFVPLLYRKDRFRLLEARNLWLSPTPDIPSMGWDAACKRVSSFVTLEDLKTGKRLYVFNTHFDHKGKRARKSAAKLVIREMGLLPEASNILVMGDLNTNPDSAPIHILLSYLEDPLEGGIDFEGPIGTYNGFRLDARLERRIDYIFVRNLEIKSYAHLGDKTPEGRWLSDHLPVLGVFLYP